jgi:hypothetical protein
LSLHITGLRPTDRQRLSGQARNKPGERDFQVQCEELLQMQTGNTRDHVPAISELFATS